MINTVEQSSAANVDLTASGFITTGQTGQFISTAQTGAFYPRSNPSGFITGISNIVYTTGNQAVSGNKVFLGNLVINNLTVTGTETIVNTDAINIGSNYLLLNVTGGEGMLHGPASDGGIFFVTGEGKTGLNDTGAILGFDSPAGKWVFGIGARSEDLENFNEIASVFNVDQLSGYVDSSFYGINNPSGFATASELATGLTGVVQLAIGYSMSSANAAVSGFANSLSGTLSGYVKTGQTGTFYTSNNPSGFITGVSQFNFNNGGDLSGSLLSPTVTKIQGNPVSNETPVGGQTLQWNGSAWVPGSIPAGGNGGGGRMYYFNFAHTSGIAPTGGLPTTGDFPLSLLGTTYYEGSGQAQSADLVPQNTNQLICGFVSASGNPGVTEIPAGLWDFNIWARVNSSSATQSSIKTIVHIYNPTNSTYRKLGESDDIYLYETDTIAQYIANVTVPQTGILATERLYIEIYGKKYTSNERRITLYFDSYRPSHVHTTIPSVAGNGVVKVINGVLQTPATGIFNDDIDANAQIQQSKIQNLTSDLANLYPRNNPSGYITGVDLSSYVTNSQTGQFVSTAQTGAFYAANNPSGFIPTISGTGVSNGGNVITGNYTVSSIVYLTQSQYNAITPDGRTLYLVV
jgi:hypothetical protein